MPWQKNTIWTGSPSQVSNMGTFILMGLLFWLVIPVFVIAWKWLVTRNIRYELTSQRLRMRSGVFNKKLEEIELYRVRDYRLDQPFFLRLFSLGNIILESSDTTAPVFPIAATPSPCARRFAPRWRNARTRRASASSTCTSGKRRQRAGTTSPAE